MPLMQCPLGAEMQTLQGDRYRDVGEGRVLVDARHLGEALIRGWRVIEEPEAEAQIEQALTQLEEGIAAEGERVEELREEALAAVPEDQAQAARAEIEAHRETSEEVASTETESTERAESNHGTSRDPEAPSWQGRPRETTPSWQRPRPRR